MVPRLRGGVAGIVIYCIIISVIYIGAISNITGSGESNSLGWIWILLFHSKIPLGFIGAFLFYMGGSLLDRSLRK